MPQAYLLKTNLLKVRVPWTFHDGKIFDIYLLKNGKPDEIRLVNSTERYFYYELNYEFGAEYQLKVNNGYDVPIITNDVTRTATFDDLFHYEGPLGPEYHKEKTIFRVWAPTATNVRIYFHDSERFVTLSRKELGVYEIEQLGDLHGTSYSLFVKVNGGWNETIDPYAYMNTHDSTRSMVVDIDRLKVERFTPEKHEHVTENLIYELHVRDYSVAGKQKTKGKYVSFLEETDYDLRYLKDLGVSHVQLLPVYDYGSVFDNDPYFYNWGYDPVQMNTIEGSYATDPNSPSKLTEFMQMIEAMHKLGLRVNLDMVFNHVFNMQDFCFEKIVPGYFFRYKGLNVSDGSFCGNDFETMRSMGRRYLIDSCMRFVEDFNVDGFRFDLMGINDIQTLNLLREKLNTIDPTIMVYGEGWSMFNTTADQRLLATIPNHREMPGIGFFNDTFRETVRQFQNKEGFVRMMQKYCYYLPFKQSINYVECHDNETLFDFLDGNFSLHNFMTSLTIIAPGIPFLHAGQQFYRSKKGVENSYCSKDDINQLDYHRADEFKDYQNYIKELIAFRHSHTALTHPDATVEYKYENDLDVFVFKHENSIVKVYINLNDYTVYKDALYNFSSSDLKMNDRTSQIAPKSLIIRG